MKTTKNRLILIGSIAAIVGLSIIAHIGNYKGLVLELANAGASSFNRLDSRFSMTASFVDNLTTYAGNYLESGAQKDSTYFSLLETDAKNKQYNMDAAGGTVLENKTGNLTGTGSIPTGGLDRREINLALSFDGFFQHMYDRMPEIAWIYYTSEQGFLYLYPWTLSTNDKYTEEMKDKTFYAAVRPKNDPNRTPVWTRVYLDMAGKGPMITLSSPVYYDNEFRGVISVDYTTVELRRLLQSSYPTYLFNQNNELIAAGGVSVSADKIFYIKDVLKLSDSALQAIADAPPGEVSAVGANYIYKAEMTDIPGTMITVMPRISLFWKTILRSLPIILTGIMLTVTILGAHKLRKTRDKLRHSALTDPLTGLKNRRFLDIVMETQIACAERHKQSLSILCIDLDRFKGINDTWGHPVGDAVLQLTADILKQTMRESDVVVRLGGEEFMILLPQAGIEAAVAAAERIRTAVERANHPIAGKFTVSIGVAERRAAETYISMYKRVDEALYAAKRAGRNCVRAFEDMVGGNAVAINLEWNTAWNCGEKTIDMQHQELVTLMNRLMGLVSYDRKKAGELLLLVVEKISEHFDYEHKVLSEAAYPDLAHHLSEHERLLELAAIVSNAYLDGRGKPQSIVTFILDELVMKHMLEEDVRYFTYLKK